MSDSKTTAQRIADLEANAKDILWRCFSHNSMQNPFGTTPPKEVQEELEGIQAEIARLKDQLVKEKAEEAKKEKQAKEELSHYRWIYVRDLYPFRGHKACSNANCGVIVKTNSDGTILFSKELHRTPHYWEEGMKQGNETFEQKIARSTFITRQEFEKTTLSEKWGIPGEIFSVIPREERFKLISHYEKPWMSRLGALSCPEGNFTRQANVDLITGGGAYFSGRILKELRKDIKDAVNAKTLDEEIRANTEFNFFYKNFKETFVVMDDVPDFWGNSIRGNMLQDKEEHTLDYWREQLLKKYGFEKVDFSKADAGRNK